MKLFLSAVVLVATSCSGGSDDDCLTDPPELRDPETLACADDICACAQCAAPLLASPTWGVCGSRCDGLTESKCAADDECRIVTDATCAIGNICLTDFLGCFPIDHNALSDLDCFAARTGWACSQDKACTAHHRPDRTFAMCTPRGVSPGTCGGTVACRAEPPECPAGHTPGISEGCYTGGCIPLDLCEPADQ